MYIVDDDPLVRSGLSEALVGMGFLTREFARIEELSQAFELEMPDVAILDVSLRGANPIDTIAWLEVLGFTGNVVLIGTEDPVQHAKVQQIGGLRELAKLPYIRKPIQIEELKGKLDIIDPIEPPAVIVDLAQALRNDWLELWYQPKVDPKSLSLRGAEALIRMRHPKWGVVALPRFDAASDEPRIRLLSEFAVRRILTDWGIFAEERMPIEIAIDMPVTILQDLAFFRFFRNHLPIHPRFPGFILQINEKGVLCDIDSTLRIARQLSLYNVRLSINDLMTCSPLWNARQDFPFAEIKVDQRFVSGCASDELKHGICQTVVDVARRFNAQTVAEGVQTPKDLLAICDIGFNAAQGFLLGPPMMQRKFIKVWSRRIY